MSKLAIKFRKFSRLCPITGYKEEAVKIGVPVIVETDRGLEYGEIVAVDRKFIRSTMGDIKLKKVVRYATEEDIKETAALAAKEEEALKIALDKVKEHELPLRIIMAEYVFDKSRVVFYYRLEEGKKSVNIRDLVKDLSSILKARIEMHLLSPVEEAKEFGRLGPCGRLLCCLQWLEKPVSVSVKMVKEQGIAISPPRTSGLCGKLMCCLAYEYSREVKHD